MPITSVIRLLLSICEMCFLHACFSTIILNSFIDASFIDKKIAVRDENFVVSGRCRRLLAFTADSRCRITYLSLLAVDVDSAFIVDSRCRRPTFRCLQSMSSLKLNLELILYNHFTTQSPKHMHVPSEITASIW